MFLREGFNETPPTTRLIHQINLIYDPADSLVTVRRFTIGSSITEIDPLVSLDYLRDFRFVKISGSAPFRLSFIGVLDFCWTE